MPSISSITLTNDATTISRVYTPVKASPGESVLIERSAVASVLDSNIQTSFSNATNNRPTHRVKVSLAIPFDKSGVDSDPNSSNVDVARFSGEWIIPDTLTTAERAEFEELSRDWIDNAVVTGFVSDLDPLY